MICAGAGAAVILALAAPGFTLDWRHSVSRDLWWERWSVTPQGLAPVEVRLTGAGAGMEPPADAVWRDGAWWFAPRVPARPSVVLATSGAADGGWRLCAEGRCHDLPEDQGPITLWSAADCAAPPK